MEQELVVSEFGLENAHRVLPVAEPVHPLAVAHCHGQGCDEDDEPDTENGSEMKFAKEWMSDGRNKFEINVNSASNDDERHFSGPFPLTPPQIGLGPTAPGLRVRPV